MPEAPRRRIPEAAPEPVLRADDSLDAVRAAAAACRRCELWEFATQAVPGEGPKKAKIMFVGEQPGELAADPGAGSRDQRDAVGQAHALRSISATRNASSRLCTRLSRGSHTDS